MKKIQLNDITDITTTERILLELKIYFEFKLLGLDINEILSLLESNNPKEVGKFLNLNDHLGY